MLFNEIKIHNENDPVTVLLKKKGQSWEEEIADKDREEMIARLNSIGRYTDPDTGMVSEIPKAEIYQKIWERRTHGRKGKPRYTEHGHEQDHPERPVHVPIIMKETEFIRFQGPVPFCAMIIPEPEVDQTGATNPFEDSNVPFSEFSQFDNAIGQHVVLKQVRHADDVVNQLFNKMVFVVFDGGTPNLVDPDFFCDR